MAAFTSVMGFMEPFTHWIEHQWQRSRAQAAVITGVLAWVISLASVISFNLAQHWQPGGKTLFGWIDFSTANIMLPLGGIMLALFAGWFLPTHTLRDELNWNMQSRAFRLWRFLLRWFIPAAIACLLVTHALS